MLSRSLATLLLCVSLKAETIQLVPQTYYRTFSHTNPVLKRIRPGDVVITKTRVSSFYASPLEAILSAQGITHLVLTGIATDGVVEGTARDAVDRGYYVVIPNDCCATFSEESHRVVLGGVLGMLTTVCKADDVITALSA